MNFKSPMHASLLALSLCVGHAAFAQTDTPEARREAALALVSSLDDVTGPGRVAREWTAMMQLPLVRALNESPNFTEAQKKRALQVFDEELGSVTRKMLNEFAPLIHHSMVTMYVQRFSADEIKELQRLYSSPLLRKATALNVGDLSRQILTSAMQKWNPSYKQALDVALGKLKSESIDLAAQPTR